MNGKVLYLNQELRSAVISLETGDCMVVSHKRGGSLEKGDLLETQGLWLGDRGEFLNRRTGHPCEVEVLSICIDPGFAEAECDDRELMI